MFCAVVLTKAPQLLERDDLAYRASIVALTQGHLTLTNGQYLSLAQHLAGSTNGVPGFGNQGILQWIHLANGNWASEKNPGYPFLAAPFQTLEILRLAPLFYGGLARLGLYLGARRWLGRWGGTWAVGQYLSCGAAIVFAWRATMPTFTDASLIAAGSGAVLWTLLAKEHSNRRRVFVGLLGFLALEAAVAVRYTDVVFLAVAAIVALLFCRRTGLPWRSLVWWFGSIAAFVGAILTWDQIVYGDAFKTGYANGEITFSLKSISPNVTHLPIHLVRSMPMLILGLLAIGWLSIRLVRSGDGRLSPEIQLRYRVDAAVGAALAAGWLGLWTLYSAYDWTVSQVSRGSVGSIHVIRFYLPAIGAIALLGAWLMKQLPGWVPTVIVVVQCGLGLMQSRTLAAAGPGGFGGPAGPVNGQLPPPGSLPGGPANGLP